MKKFISLSLSLLLISSFLTLNVTKANASEANNANNYNSNIVRGPLTGPDGENLYPGGETSPEINYILTNIYNDQFVFWGSSIFSPWDGNPIMLNNTLTLQRHSIVASNPINFVGSTRYRVSFGRLNGTINVLIFDQANGLVLSEQTLTGNGNEVSFDYSHINHWPATGPSIIQLTGVSDSSMMSNFRIDRYDVGQ